MRLFHKACTWLLLLSCCAVLAEETSLTYEETLELVLQRNPILRAETAAQSAASQLVEQAGAGPNPYVQLQFQTDGLDRVSQLGLAVGQRLELGGKRQARIRAAEAAERETQLASQLRFCRLRLETRQRFLRLLLAQEQERLAQVLLELTERHLGIAETRLKNGDVAGVEVLSLQSEKERRQAQLLLSRGERRQAAVALAELLADADAPLEPRVIGALEPETGELPGPEELWERLQEQNFALQKALAGSENKDALHLLEQANGVSDLSVQLGLYMQRDVFEANAFRPAGSVLRLEDTAPLVQLQLQIPLPLNDTNSGNIKAAKARHEQALAEIEILQHRLRSQVYGLHHSLQAQRLARKLISEQILPNAERTLETTETAYRLGFRSLVELLLARESYLKARQDLLQAAYDESMTLAALEAVVGCPLEGAPEGESDE